MNKAPRRSPWQWVLTLLGCFSLLLGLIAIVVPLLPTTPFLILSAFLFSRSSPRFYRWLIHHRHLGPPIVDWQRHRAIALRYKWMATTLLGFSAAFVLPRSAIPVAGKVGFSTVAITCLIWIWLQRSSRKRPLPR